MRILILSQYFTPEITAAAPRLRSFAAHLAARGDEVKVICEVPNHPEGVVRPGFRRRLSVQEELDGFNVQRVWVRTSPRKTALTRILLYGSYASLAVAAGSASKRPDVVLASSPPLTTGASGSLVARRHRTPWVMDVRDLWPDVPVALGELSNPRLARLAERLERRLYASASGITAANDAMAAAVAAKTGDATKVHVVHNGTNEEWLAAAAQEPDRAELGIPAEPFVWTYAGNIGLAQGLDTALDAAELLGEGYCLLLLGEGPSLDRLKARASEMTGGRVEFHPPVPPGQAALLMRASDALLVPLDPHPAMDTTVPIKLFDSCAVGRPVILAARGESLRLAGDSGAALPVPPGDPQALADAVRALRDDGELRARLGRSGHEFASGYVRTEQAARMAAVLDSVAASA